MPKSHSFLSPSNHISHSRTHSDGPISSSRMSDVALRKKKNADAQAAFRARRASYIATLEETVTSLESVVIQLQDSCKEARTEATDLRQDNSRLRHEFREREKFWRALWQARKTGHGPESDDMPPLPPSFSPVHSHTTNLNSHMGPSHVNHYSNEGMGYRSNDDPPAPICNGPYTAGPSHNYTNHSPSMPYVSVENEHIPGDGSSHSLGSHRVPKYGPYSYAMNGSHRSGPWPQAIAQSGSSGGESGAPTSTNSSHSPGFVESPTLTSAEMSYVNRFPVEDQKVPLNSLDTAPYVFPSSRSLSPTASSTPPSSSSTSLASTFQFTFSENSMAHDRPEFDYRRHSNNTHSAEVTLHGGTADISLAGPGSDAVRYRLGSRRTNSGPERTLLSALPPMSGSDNGSQHERGSSEGESAAYTHHPRLRPRRGTEPLRTSRSPSPDAGTGGPPISGTLAVIKAQAFGALRRTRARTKKSSEGAAKVAMDVLEARGIGMGVSVGTGSKRPRLQSEKGDMET